jgi:SAM-dependent methyltransferase
MLAGSPACREEKAVDDEAIRQQKALQQFVASGQYRHRVYGMEWGDPYTDPTLSQVLHRFLLPFLAPQSVVLEIGAGGGRWSRHMAGRVGRLILVDGAPEFETAIRRMLDCRDLDFVVSAAGRLPRVPTAGVDFVFSFDTFVHFHPPLFDAYVASVGRVLRPGGHFTLHHARRYEGCDFDPRCFQYRDEVQVDALLRQHGLEPTGFLPLPCGLGSRVVLAQAPAR